MDTRTNYRLAEKQAQERLAEFSNDVDSSDLSRELALARLMLEEAHKSGNATLARDLLASIAALSKAHQVAMERRGELMDRPTLQTRVKAMGEIVIKHLRIHCPDKFETIVDCILADLDAELQKSQTSTAIEYRR